MKVKVSPTKFKTLIEAGMITSGSSSQMKSIRIRPKKNVIAIIESSPSSDIASIIMAKSAYFEEYDPGEVDSIPIHQEILDRLSDNVKGKSATIFTDGKTISITDGVDKVNGEIIEIDAGKFPIPLSSTQFGIFPDFNKFHDKGKTKEWNEELSLKGFNIIKTTATALKLPKMENYTFKCKKNVLSVSMKYTTTSVDHTIEGEHIVSNDVDLIVDGEYYRSILSNLSGEVHLIYDKLKMIFMEKNDENLLKTYALATKIVSD